MPKYEKEAKLSEKTLDLERARQSLVEELEAINWYQERIDSSKNASLKKILEHNRDEEKEHVAMLLEWIRKNDKAQDRMFGEHD
ncbi:MAG: ferritin [Candidatus Micrarchaeota archaeon]